MPPADTWDDEEPPVFDPEMEEPVFDPETDELLPPEGLPGLTEDPSVGWEDPGENDDPTPSMEEPYSTDEPEPATDSCSTVSCDGTPPEGACEAAVATPDDELVDIEPDGEMILLETEVGQDGVVRFDAPVEAKGFVLEWVSHYPSGGSIHAPDGSSSDFLEPESWQELEFSIPEPGSNSIYVDPTDDPSAVIEDIVARVTRQPRARVGGSMTLRLRTVPKYRIELRTFIPGDHVTSVAMGCRRNWHSLPRRVYFEGDDRNFMRNPSSYRTQQLITMVANSRGDADGYLSGSYRASVGRTRSYASNALDNGVIDQRDRDGRLNDCHLLHQEKTLCISCNDHFDVSYSRRSGRAVRVRLSGDAKNPLTRVGCGISYHVTLNIGESTAGRRPWYVLGIDHDGFPAYELYVNDQPIYTYRPSGRSPYSASQVLTLCGDKEKSATRSGSLS